MPSRRRFRSFRTVSDDRVDLIADYLSEDWIEEWAGEGVRQVEDYLAKHAAFEAFLGDGDDS
jgi:hypothetical protein